jgi:hypothetical protein
LSGTDFNAILRRAAGREQAPALELEQPVADFGLGRGGAALPQPRPTSNAHVNARIRAGARVARAFTVPGGVRLDDVDLDRLYGR